eukprot:COSAG01_NODE_461_length_16698_cov_113.458160_20_plen_53_part_00
MRLNGRKCHKGAGRGGAGRIESTAERACGGMWGLALVRVRVKIMGSIIIRTG